jgi:hypothetical protein
VDAGQGASVFVSQSARRWQAVGFMIWAGECARRWVRGCVGASVRLWMGGVGGMGRVAWGAWYEKRGMGSGTWDE